MTIRAAAAVLVALALALPAPAMCERGVPGYRGKFTAQRRDKGEAYAFRLFPQSVESQRTARTICAADGLRDTGLEAGGSR